MRELRVIEGPPVVKRSSPRYVVPPLPESAADNDGEHMDRYHVVSGGYLRWLVCDRERDDQVVAVERSYELAQDRANELNEEARGAAERA
ncbi:hypothetical protein [Candidatus Nephthysia bennettiae]|uniref:hypothetical protein n=1 Tax=Candidatus Nephthysia bennettiae TaxID=3127016 RepID=UPI0030C6BD83